MADAVPHSARQTCMSAPLLKADSLGFVCNLHCGDRGVICDRLEGQIEFTLRGWLQMAESLSHYVKTASRFLEDVKIV